MPIRASEKARYPSNWKEIRAAILKRANEHCEFCGVCNHSLIHRTEDGFQYVMPIEVGLRGIKAIRIVLTVAHLDHTPENCNPGNLQALCQKCHLTHDARHHAKNAAKTRRAKKNNLELFPEITP